jgi:hypothetical protein
MVMGNERVAGFVFRFSCSSSSFFSETAARSGVGDRGLRLDTLDTIDTMDWLERINNE